MSRLDLDLDLRLPLLALLGVAAIFPPETRGESMAGCAVLLILSCLVVVWRRPAAPSGQAMLATLLALAWPLAWAACAPGAAVEPLALFFLAGAAGVLAAATASALRQGESLPGLLAGTGGLVALHALYQKLWGLERLAIRLETIASGLPDRDLVLARVREGRAFGAFATPAALGGFLALVLPVTVGLALARRGRARILLFLVAGLEGAGLLASASATACAALAVAVVLYAAFARGSRRGLAMAALAGALLLAGVVVLRGGKILDAASATSPWGLRAGNMRIALSMIRDHPWLGVGPGGFGEMFPAYRRPGDDEAQHAHNLPLELGATLGLGGGVVLSALFFWLFLGPLRTARDKEPAWARGGAVGLAAFALQNLADFTAFFASLLWVAAVLRGAIARESGSVGRFHPGIEGLLRAALAGGVVLAGSAAALSGLSSNARVWAREAVATGDLHAAEVAARRAARLAPWDASSRMLLAEVLLEDDTRTASALEQAERAVTRSPVRPAARHLRARARLRLGDVPGAYADLVEAARLYPARLEYARERDSLALRLPGPPGEGDRP